MRNLIYSEVCNIASRVNPLFITKHDVQRIFESCDALWLHSGDAKAPHAELTSGKCSDGFVDTLRVLKYPLLCETLAQQLVRLVPTEYANRIHWVIGSDHAGATLSYEVAKQLKAQHDFTEKGPGKTQSWKRFEISTHESVLQVEELVTTAGTLSAVRDGIRAGNPNAVTFVPFVLTLIHRSDVTEFEGKPIRSLAHFDIKTWEPKNCPLCEAGSVRLRPKQHWARLTESQPPTHT